MHHFLVKLRPVVLRQHRYEVAGSHIGIVPVSVVDDEVVDAPRPYTVRLRQAPTTFPPNTPSIKLWMATIANKIGAHMFKLTHELDGEGGTGGLPRRPNAVQNVRSPPMWAINL